SAGNVTQDTAVGAMNGRRRESTKGTARRWMCCDNRNEQTSVCDLYLIDEHPFGKWKKWGPFHHHLASQTTLHSTGFSWKVVYQFRSLCGKEKQASGSTKRGHEPEYPSQRVSASEAQCFSTRRVHAWPEFSSHILALGPG